MLLDDVLYEDNQLHSQQACYYEVQSPNVLQLWSWELQVTFLNHANEDLLNVQDYSLGDLLDLELRAFDGKEEERYPMDLHWKAYYLFDLVENAQEEAACKQMHQSLTMSLLNCGISQWMGAFELEKKEEVASLGELQVKSKHFLLSLLAIWLLLNFLVTHEQKIYHLKVKDHWKFQH